MKEPTIKIDPSNGIISWFKYRHKPT